MTDGTSSTPATGSAARRQRADGKKRQAGLVRMSVWVPANCVAHLDWLSMRTRGLRRSMLIEVAVLHLARQISSGELKKLTGETPADLERLVPQPR